MSHVVRTVSWAGIAVLVALSAGASAFAQDAPAPVIVEVTEPEPGTSQLLEEKWPVARRERADRILLDGRIHTVQTLVAALRRRDLSKTAVVLACHRNQPASRLLAVADALRKAELSQKELRIALQASPGKAIVCEIIGAAARTIQLFGRSGVIEVGGDSRALESDDETWRTVAFRLEIKEGDLAVVMGHGKEAKTYTKRNDIREALAEAVDGEDADDREVRGRIQPAADVGFGALFSIVSLVRDLDVPRVQIAREWVSNFSDWAARWATDRRDWIGEEIADGLKALAATQKPIGSWSGRSIELDDIGRTGLALLTFMAELHSPEEGEYADEVAAGLRFLMQRQETGGRFAGVDESCSVNHAIATRAMVEAYGLTGDEQYERSANRALRALAGARRADGAWAVVGGKVPDVILTTWAAMAISAAVESGLDADSEQLEKTAEWVDGGRLEDGGTKLESSLGFGVDRFFGRHSRSLAMASMLLRNRLGVEAKGLRDSEKLVLSTGPNEANGLPDYDYLFFGSLALNDIGSTHWEPWRKELDVAVFRCLARARGDTDGEAFFGGSHRVARAAEEADPAATAYLTLCLINSYRFSQSFEAPK